MNKRAKKAVNVTVSVLLYMLLACCFLLMIVSAVSAFGGKKTGLFGVGLFQIVSGSMAPEVNVGDVIIGKKTDLDDLAVGDNLIFNYNGRVVTHKLIAADGDRLTTHGVANAEGANESITYADVIAKQVLRIPKFGYVLNFLRSGAGFFIVIALPIGGLVVYHTVSLSRKIREYKRADDDTKEIRDEIDALKARLGDAGEDPRGSGDNANENEEDE